MRAVGIVLAGGSSGKMGDLARRRATAALPIAGTYRAIDFVLSNMSNSRINRVAVFTQFNAKSLNEHLNSSKWWDFGRKQGGLFVLHPTITMQNSNWYRGTSDAMLQNMDFLKKSHEPYVVIASGDGVYKMDYNAVLEYHIAKRADITVVTKDLPSWEDPKRFGIVCTDEDGRVTSYEEKPIVPKGNTVSAGIYVIWRRLLIELLEETGSEGRYDFVQDVVIRYSGVKQVYAYKMDSYWNNVGSVQAYYNTNMDFLKKDVRDYFFKKAPGIYTRTEDLPPAKFNHGARCVNSLVAPGCIINGTVENSVLFHKAYVGNGTVIKNSILLDDVYVGDNTYIENCIIESRDTLRSNTSYVGEGEPKIVFERNERYVI